MLFYFFLFFFLFFFLRVYVCVCVHLFRFLPFVNIFSLFIFLLFSFGLAVPRPP